MSSVEEAIEHLSKLERSLDHDIKEHYEKAQARHDGSNDKGASISMRKVYRLQVHQAKILAAIIHLQELTKKSLDKDLSKEVQKILDEQDNYDDKNIQIPDDEALLGRLLEGSKQHAKQARRASMTNPAA
mmetsp:Transcript_8866/g.19148  ORF Transcript_8866/g.19148 Transcript_8866/m.19148 type:complete len:130 (+) Transcript_8866:147-536(+)